MSETGHTDLNLVRSFIIVWDDKLKEWNPTPGLPPVLDKKTSLQS